MGLLDWFKGLFKEEEKEEIVFNPDYEIVGFLESYIPSASELELDKIESISESLIRYSGALVKDVAGLKKIKEESELAFLFSRVKRVGEDALELNNLLDQLLSYHYDSIKEILEKVNLIRPVDKFLGQLSRERKGIEETSVVLNEFYVYYGLLNPDEREAGEIKKELMNADFKRKFLKTLNLTGDLLNSNCLNIKSKIDLKILEKAQEEVFK